MIIKTLEQLKAMATPTTVQCYVDGVADLGIFRMRYDPKEDRFIVFNTNRDWNFVAKTSEFFEGESETLERARMIGKGLNAQKLKLTPKDMYIS